MPDVLRHVPAAASVPSITVASTTLPAQRTLAPISNLQTAATIVVTGGEGTLTYSWSSASGGTFGDAAALNSSYTPTGGGVHTLVLVVTDANGATAIITLSLTVGVQDPTSKEWWVRLWRLNPADQADHDFVSSALTVDGVEVRNGSEGAVTTMAISGGVCTCDTIAAGAIGGLWIYPVEARDDTMQIRYAMILAIGAEITADDDGVFMQYSNFGGAIYGNVEAYRAAGVQRVRVARNGGATGSKAVPAGAQARAIGMEWAPGRQSFRPTYSTAAHSGNGHSPVDMTAIALTPSGWHSSSDVTPAETSDDFPADNNVGSNPVELVAKCRPANGRAYTFGEWSLWAAI